MNVKNLVLGVGIFIVFLLMLSYGIEAFYPSPQYSDFCKGDLYAKPYPPSYPAGNCNFSQSLQQQTEQCSSTGGVPVYSYDSQGCVSAMKECNDCSKRYDEAQKSYSKVVFIIALIAGIITLLIGYGILSVEPVGSALIASGIGSIFYGSVRNWQNLSDVWRFLLLLIALVLLVWIALRINKQRSH